MSEKIFFSPFAHYKEKLDDGEKREEFSASLIIFAHPPSTSSFSPFFYFHKSLFASCLFSLFQLLRENLILCWALYLSIFLFFQMKRNFQHFFSFFISTKMFSFRTSSIELRALDLDHEFPSAGLLMLLRCTHLKVTCKLSSSWGVQLTGFSGGIFIQFLLNCETLKI